MYISKLLYLDKIIKMNSKKAKMIQNYVRININIATYRVSW